jgi:hypothetical protein
MWVVGGVWHLWSCHDVSAQPWEACWMTLLLLGL